MLRSAELAEVESDLESQIKPLMDRLTDVRQQKRKALAIEWIAANNVTLADIQESRGDGVPHCGHVTQFIEWLKANPSNKRFAEWNTVIHFKGDLLEGRFISQPACMDDLS